MATHIGYPTDTTRRILQDLAAMGVTQRRDDKGKHRYQLTDEARGFWIRANTILEGVAEKSSGEGIERECNDIPPPDISATDLGAQEVSP